MLAYGRGIVRKDGIKLLALARSGDALARIEAGRRYLLGIEGFPAHVQSGIDYLTHPSMSTSSAAAEVLAQHVALDTALEAGLLPLLKRLARSGFGPAQVKWAAWLLARDGAGTDGLAMLRAAAEQGCEPAAISLSVWNAALSAHGPGRALCETLQALEEARLLDAGKVMLAAARHALQDGHLGDAALSLSASFCLGGHTWAEGARLVFQALQAAQAKGCQLPYLDTGVLEAALDMLVSDGDVDAAYALGRALCGLALGVLPARAIVERQNVRKGAALLLRAADAGCDVAWMDLYRVHADPYASVANPTMAFYCLEKMAARGDAQARRRLGALLLKRADTLAATERAIAWLHQAAASGDAHAVSLLHSLVLPVSGEESSAADGIAQVAALDPWLAARMRVARAFGLTKLEALTFDPVSGSRPWGLVIGKNPFVSKIRLSSPRAVPALTPAAFDHLTCASSLFAQAGRQVQQGDLRRRSLNQRRLFARLGLVEDWFFARASSTALEALRIGSKWAFRARESLQLALADR